MSTVLLVSCGQQSPQTEVPMLESSAVQPTSPPPADDLAFPPRISPVEALAEIKATENVGGMTDDELRDHAEEMCSIYASAESSDEVPVVVAASMAHAANLDLSAGFPVLAMFWQCPETYSKVNEMLDSSGW